MADQLALLPGYLAAHLQLTLVALAMSIGFCQTSQAHPLPNTKAAAFENSCLNFSNSPKVEFIASATSPINLVSFLNIGQKKE